MIDTSNIVETKNVFLYKNKEENMSCSLSTYYLQKVDILAFEAYLFGLH